MYDLTMRVLLTGASGFVGSRLKDTLILKGYDVFSTDVWGQNLSARGDLRDNKFVLSLFKENKFDVVIHAAAAVPLLDDVNLFQEVNIDMSQKLARISKLEGVATFVFISSSAPYGRPKEFPITPLTPLSPIEPYGQSKLVAEDLIREIWDANSNLIIVRPRTIIGPERLGIFEILFRWATQNFNIPLPNGGKHFLQLVHIDDLCALTEHLISNRLMGIWPAGAPNHDLLSIDLVSVFSENGSRSRIVSISPFLFRLAGKVSHALRLSPFTPWHYSTLDTNFGFISSWKPETFQYKHSNRDCLNDAFRFFRNGNEKEGLSAHTRRWPTRFLDYTLRLFTLLTRIVRS